MAFYGNIQQEINDLKEQIANHIALVETMINSVVNGLLNRDENILKSVISVDEVFINKKEIEIENKCIELLAQFSPKASNLRAILMIMKMNNDIERMADHCSNIARLSLDIINLPFIKKTYEINIMSNAVLEMLKKFLSAFLNENTLLAKDICKDDDEIDAIYDYNKKEIAELCKNDSLAVTRALALLSISSNLERIADLITNLAENYVFMIDGKVIKHNSV